MIAGLKKLGNFLKRVGYYLDDKSWVDAIMREDIEILNRYIAADQDLTAKIYGQKPIFIAVACAKPQVLRRLLQARPQDVNLVNDQGATLMHYAAIPEEWDTFYKGFCKTPLKYDCAEVLIEFGFNSFDTKFKGHTPLDIALSYKGNFNIIKLILDAQNAQQQQANPNLFNERKIVRFQYMDPTLARRAVTIAPATQPKGILKNTDAPINDTRRGSTFSC